MSSDKQTGRKRTRVAAAAAATGAESGNDAHGSAKPMQERFRSVAASVSCAFGSPWALTAAVALILVWAVTGPYFGFSDGWQLVVNTGTTIVTFLMAFLIQATQYRESRALHLKIDELIRAVHGARNGFVNLEELSDEQVEALARDLQQYGSRSKILPIAQAKVVPLPRGKRSTRVKRSENAHEPG